MVTRRSVRPRIGAGAACAGGATGAEEEDEAAGGEDEAAGDATLSAASLSALRLFLRSRSLSALVFFGASVPAVLTAPSSLSEEEDDDVDGLRF